MESDMGVCVCMREGTVLVAESGGCMLWARKCDDIVVRHGGA